MKTVLPKHELDHNKKVWHHIDATGMTLGRLATDVACKLQGKHKPWYCEMWDCGDYVVVTNVEKIVVTGKKLLEKMYYTHSGYKGHLTELNYQQMVDKDPTSVLILAVKGMLAKNKHRKARLKKLKTFVGPDHNFLHQINQSE
jgi:large subunit ribosomal protein L13